MLVESQTTSGYSIATLIVQTERAIHTASLMRQSFAESRSLPPDPRKRVPLSQNEQADHS
ncbi:hypothetical protein BAUCODRAFT_29838 [Baudoinia panamericana UAMH 10762]|uniref:Uncharacterized protein n=1 Tax=Baudoinia panamericana (strain UAMH 10762) TaxID=717646 RepID=M2LXT3_BAUPA|nr:uncharacterized protein BAUCODRAFT_29838 [Baudoinia panamericana UAMH 10762]EMC99487.1 hypothetical protein BAUCODRAFT_29838 [Baudoinia panamericana UAMH 10762]